VTHKKFKFSKLLPKTRTKTSIPGDVDYVGKKREEPVVIDLLDYDKANYTEKKIGNIKDYVISFEERHGDILEPLRERIRNNKGRIRRLNSDYLCYSIIDTIIDHYFTILESIGEQIEELEDHLIDNPEKKTLNSIYKLKQELVYLRKSIWPTREVVSWLQRTEHKLIDESVFIYLRDVYDHTVQVVETVETFRDLASGMLDLYLSTVSNKMNEVMKVLTIFAVIFIPLTFIAGVYGMNFEYFPELHWKFGYFGVLGIMTLVVIIMIIYFKKKKWM
jgi:magnesium transporter